MSADKRSAVVTDDRVAEVYAKALREEIAQVIMSFRNEHWDYIRTTDKNVLAGAVLDIGASLLAIDRGITLEAVDEIFANLKKIIFERQKDLIEEDARRRDA